MIIMSSETGIGESSSAGGSVPILLEVNKQAGVSSLSFLIFGII